jgi:NTE family protein
MSQFRNLVFEGGGVKGIAYAGALKVLQEKEILKDITRVAGTSAGAIISTLVALGGDVDRITDIASNTPYNEFMDSSHLLIPELYRTYKKYGWFRGESFTKWIREKIGEVCGNPDITFGELAEKAGTKSPGGLKFRKLYMIASDVSLQTPLLCSHNTKPKLPIWKAVRMSMSIPFFFASVKLRIGKNEDVIVDGGVTWNYPIDLFDRDSYLDSAMRSRVKFSPDRKKLYGNHHEYNFQTLGFRVAPKDKISADIEAAKKPAKIDNVIDYAKFLALWVWEAANNAHLEDYDWHRTVFLDSCGIHTTDFNLSDDQVKKLIKSGEDNTEKYFEWFQKDYRDEKELPLNRLE